jgi:LysM repeat protein
MVHRSVFLYAILVFLLSSCSQPTFQPTPTIKPTGVLTPYHTVTPSPVHPTAKALVTIPFTPAPTATPFTHTVIKGETMLGIAFQYGISLGDLQAANPTVNPHFLSVGTQLVIPINGEIPETVPTPTAVLVDWQQPDCYHTGDGGAWCILTVRNQLETDIENISAVIGLFTPQGTNITNQVAYSLLNILRAGDTMPLMNYFPAPLPAEFVAQGEILSGLAVPDGDTRYLDLEASVQSVDISSDGIQAMVTCEVVLPNGMPQPAQLWVLLVAYDSNGNIVGARRWESMGETQFELPVYSIAGQIDRVEALTEARP